MGRWGIAAAWALALVMAAPAIWAAAAEPGLYRYVDLARPYAAGAAVLIAVLAAARRRWGGTLASAAAAGCAAAGILGAPVHRGPGVDGGCTPLRVATANLYEGNCCADAVWAALAAVDADLLATLELTPGMAELEARLREAYPWSAVSPPVGLSSRRVALWSRLPMANDPVLSTGPHPFHVLAAPRTAAGMELRVMAMHLGWPPLLERYNPIQDFPRFQAAFEGHAIVLGDFNAPRWSWAVRRIADISGAAPLGGWRPTWPGAEAGGWARRLGLPIDHVLVDDALTARVVRAFDIPGSDHLGVVADLCVPRPRAAGAGLSRP